MVIPFDFGDAPLTAIWAIHEDPLPKPNSPPPQHGPWRAIVAHWNKINYAAEKGKKAGEHPTPDYMGDVVDPRSSAQFPGNIILNATVEGRLLETSFQEKPFKQDSRRTGDKLTIMIDGDAKEGDRPNYRAGDRAFLCGFASHTPPSGKGSEMIKPIFRDDFCTWGHITEGGKRWKIIPMYFISHGGGIDNLTNPTTKYKFTKQPPRQFTSQMIAAAPDLQGLNLERDETAQDQPGDQAPKADGAEDRQIIGAGDIQFGTAADEPSGDNEVTFEDEAFLTKPLTEDDFGEEAAAADKAAAEDGNDW